MTVLLTHETTIDNTQNTLQIIKMSWIVVTLKPNQTKKAEENLANQGFETFFPKITYPFNGKSITKDLFLPIFEMVKECMGVPNTPPI